MWARACGTWEDSNAAHDSRPTNPPVDRRTRLHTSRGPLNPAQERRGRESSGVPCSERRRIHMAKAASGGKSMTKSEIATTLAETAGLSKKQVTQLLQAQAELAYKQAKNTFVIPGIGKLVLAESPAREMVMRFGPKAGQTVKVPKRKKVKFRIAKAAKDAILGAKK